MERLDADVCSVKSALQKGPKAFEAISMNQTVNIFLRVIDNFMRIVFCKSGVRLERIAVERGAFLDVLFDFRLQRFLFAVHHDTRSHLPAPLKNTHDDNLIVAARSVNLSLPVMLVHEPRLAADESFVNLNMARKLAAVRALQSEPESLQHEPRGLLRDADGAVHFIRANAILTVNEECNPP